MKIDHIAMYVRDLEGAKHFFESYFSATANCGYHNQTTDFRSYFLTFPDGGRLEIMNRPNLEAGSESSLQWGYHHIAFSVGSKERVDTLTAQLAADGFQIISGPRTTGDGYYESCILAFEGNLIEITE